MANKYKRVHISILKPGRAGPGPRKKEDWTCAYISNEDYAELLTIAGDDRVAVAKAFRLASERLVKREGRAWSATCLAGARTILKKARDAVAAHAAANNAAWDAVQ